MGKNFHYIFLYIHRQKVSDAMCGIIILIESDIQGSPKHVQSQSGSEQIQLLQHIRHILLF